MTNLGDHNGIYQKFLEETEANSVDERLATHHYVERCREIKENARIRNRFDFLRWPSLADFSVPESWIPSACYDELRRSPEWSERWFRLTRESKIGTPKDFSRDFGTSPILVQHAYHLLRYETATNKSLLNCDAIFEIGGGYGSFCRLLRNAGFSGLHIIYDLPHISSIQRLYLTLSGFTEVPREEMSQREEHGFCLIVDEYLDNAFNFLKSGNVRVGFVATWSLSETPMSVRERIFPRFYQVCQQYLIAFQPAWQTINNVDYFAAFPTFRPELNWLKEEMPRTVPPPSFYLFA
jgi:hypothetical protein